MLVVISQRESQDKHGQAIDYLEEAYVQYLQMYGIDVLPLPNVIQNIPQMLDRIKPDGIILSGGNYVDPQSYGEKREEGLALALQRDKVEKEMINYALNKKLPVLGICRGMQFINVHFSGKLLDLRKKNIIHPPGKDHPISITVLELGRESMVNSYHNQGITTEILAPELKPFALTGELVEGFYHSHLPIAGILWHPERKSPDPELNRKLITAFKEGKLFWKK